MSMSLYEILQIIFGILFVIVAILSILFCILALISNKKMKTKNWEYITVILVILFLISIFGYVIVYDGLNDRIKINDYNEYEYDVYSIADKYLKLESNPPKDYEYEINFEKDDSGIKYIVEYKYFMIHSEYKYSIDIFNIDKDSILKNNNELEDFKQYKIGD